MVEPLCKSITLEEFLQLEETKPAREYIDGHIIQKPMPQGKHSAIQTELAAIINTALKPQKLGRAFAELRCTFGNRSIVPDIAVFSWQQIPRDQNGKIANAFAIAPNWIIEILSPEQNQTRVTKNIVCSLQYGTEMGWLIDPAEQTIFVYVPDQQLQICDQIDQQLPVPPFAEVLHLSLGTVFECLQL
ncbi:MAG: Uma2 family endonuclease [Pseudanabaenaceae cyanobacterium]